MRTLLILALVVVLGGCTLRPSTHFAECRYEGAKHGFLHGQSAELPNWLILCMEARGLRVDEDKLQRELKELHFEPWLAYIIAEENVDVWGWGLRSPLYIGREYERGRKLSFDDLPDASPVDYYEWTARKFGGNRVKQP